MRASETAVNHDQRQRGSERKTRVRVTKAVGVSVDGGGRGGVACMAGRGTADIADAGGGGASGGRYGKEIDAVTPADLCQQVRDPTLRYKRLHWEHCLSSDTMCHPCPL